MPSQPLLRVFIGYDPVETVAWHTFAHSILRQSTIPVALVPVNIRNLGGIFTRPRDA
ncbi:MAG: glycosyltransferase, partial [Betaproteobacteria bacterium]|nr:glycosyltransferase [Betaproteobacteria bacterium]